MDGDKNLVDDHPSTPPKAQEHVRPSAQSPNPNPTTIFDEAQECLSQSNLMFLYADLRLLSATGRINTKFETLCIDSDRVSRTSAAELAQLPGINDIETDRECESVSPAQIMAILIVELRQEVLAQRKRAKEQVMRRENRGSVIAQERDGDYDEDEDDDDAGVLNKIRDRKGRKEWDTDMHAMIRTYNDMLAKDLKGIPEVKIVTNPLTKSKLGGEDGTPRKILQPKTWMRKSNQMNQLRLFNFEEGDEQPHRSPSQQSVTFDEYDRSDSVARVTRSWKPKPLTRQSSLKESDETSLSCEEKVEDTETTEPATASNNPHQGENHRNKVALGLGGRATPSKLFDIIDSMRGMKSSQDRDLDIMSDPGVNSSIGEDGRDSGVNMSINEDRVQRRPTLTSQLSEYIAKVKEYHALFDKNYFLINPEDYNTFNKAEDIGNKLFNMEGLKASIALSSVPETTAIGQQPDRNMSETELLDFMVKCIESRDVDRLGFMQDFFKEDSISQVMMKSTARVVWMQGEFGLARCSAHFIASVHIRSHSLPTDKRTRSDWYPIKDCIYAISVDKEKKRVSVVFRGAITRPDWNHAFDGALKKCPNPVKDNYEGRANFIRCESVQL